MTLDFTSILARWQMLADGAWLTVQLASITTLTGFLIGTLCAVARRSDVRWLSSLAGFYVELIRNTPFLVQIYFIFFALPLAGIKLSPTPTAVIALGVNGGAYAIEIIRGGVESINKGQIEAGLALGLRRLQVFRLIVLKPALRAIYPSLVSQFILLTLTTSITSAVAAYELTSVAKLIENESFRSFEVYFTVTVLYLIMSWLMMRLLALVGWRYLAYPVK
jgi:polar amino acid transport system permease protein